jgi:hypothetical protein
LRKISKQHNAGTTIVSNILVRLDYSGTEIAQKEGFVAMGDNQHVFLLYTKQDEQTS